MKKRICEICGKDFTKDNPIYNQLYCSRKCAKEGNNRTARALRRKIAEYKRTHKTFPKMICPHCGYTKQLKFCILEDWDKAKKARCPKCRKLLFQDEQKTGQNK